MPLIATILTLITLALWSSLAYLVSQLSQIPPILSVGIALSISGLIGIIRIRDWRVNLKTLTVGVAGIFGYHFLYFTALHMAPPIETSLINYLWPLLIVVLSPLFLHGYILRPYHIIGALLGFIGAV
jgi:drug/metabolite transporter (DMT)-like permease